MGNDQQYVRYGDTLLSVQAAETMIRQLLERVGQAEVELTAVKAENDHLNLRSCVACDKYGICAIYRAAPQPRHAFACNRWEARP